VGLLLAVGWCCRLSQMLERLDAHLKAEQFYSGGWLFELPAVASLSVRKI
jgi:hypothetical protein